MILPGRLGRRRKAGAMRAAPQMGDPNGDVHSAPPTQLKK